MPWVVLVPSIFDCTLAGMLFVPCAKQAEVVAGHEDRARYGGALAEAARRGRSSRRHRGQPVVTEVMTSIWLKFAVTLFAQAKTTAGRWRRWPSLLARQRPRLRPMQARRAPNYGA